MTIELTADDEASVEEFAGSLFGACLATMELANVELGIRLGSLRGARGRGTGDGRGAGRTAGIAPRYAREWLEQQAVAGVVEVDDTTKPADERRFELPNAHAHVLLDDDSEACMKPCAAVVPWLAKAIDIMVEEFRAGHGRGVRTVRSPRRPGRVHAAGVREPPDPELAAGDCPTCRRSSTPATRGADRRGRLR